MKRFLVAEEASWLLGITLPAFRAKVHRRQIEVIRMGRSVLVDPGALEAFIQAHRIPAE